VARVPREKAALEAADDGGGRHAGNL